MAFTHLQPAFCDRKPPIIGPITGPRRGPNAKTAVAVPRPSESNKSDTMPPPIERHAEPPSPAKRRNMRRDVMFGARAQASCQMAKIVVVMSRIFPTTVSSIRQKRGGPMITYYFTTILLAQGSRDQRTDLCDIPVYMPPHCFEVYSPRIPI